MWQQIRRMIHIKHNEHVQCDFILGHSLCSASTLCHSYLSSHCLRRHFFITVVSMNLNVSLNEMSATIYFFLFFRQDICRMNLCGVKQIGNVNNQNGKINAIQCSSYVLALCLYDIDKVDCMHNSPSLNEKFHTKSTEKKFICVYCTTNGENWHSNFGVSTRIIHNKIDASNNKEKKTRQRMKKKNLPKQSQVRRLSTW